MAKARPDYPHYRVSERAKSISSHKGAEGTKLPPPVRMAVNVVLCVAVVVLYIAIVAIWSFIILYGAKLRKVFHISK